MENFITNPSRNLNKDNSNNNSNSSFTDSPQSKLLGTNIFENKKKNSFHKNKKVLS